MRRALFGPGGSTSRADAAAVAGGRAGGLDGAGVSVAGFGGAAERVERLAVVVEALGIVLATLGVEGQFAFAPRRTRPSARYTPPSSRWTSLELCFSFWPDGGLEMRQGIVEPALFAGDAAELEMRVGLGGVDRDGRLEAADGLGVLAALLVDEAELILRLAIVGIDGGGFEHAAKVLAAAQSVAEAGGIRCPGNTSDRRGRRARRAGRRSSRADPRAGQRAASGIQERHTIPAAAPLLAPKTVRTAKNISTAK